jgi:hypothetical protein
MMMLSVRAVQTGAPLILKIQIQVPSILHYFPTLRSGSLRKKRMMWMRKRCS